MKIIYSFLFAGIVCLIAEILVYNTKLKPGHITSLFVIIGSILSFFNIYDSLTNYSYIGSSIPITSFGNLLYKSCLEGYTNQGIIGLLSNMYKNISRICLYYWKY